MTVDNRVLKDVSRMFSGRVSAVSETPSEPDTEDRRAIQLKDVDVSFHLSESSDFHALSAANLVVGRNEFVTIVGPTGCGKSTILNVMAGLVAPSAGSIEVFGKPLVGTNRQAGYLFQQDALLPWKTVGENVALGLIVAGTPAPAARAIANQWLSRVGLNGFADRFPAKLSGGQRKRVGLAQVLIRNPQILLMDEPFGPLDAQTRLLMGDLLLKLWSEDRKTVVFVTHDLDEAIALGDRIVILSAGPRSTIIGDFTNPLPRPRDISEIRYDANFISSRREIWGILKTEVMKAYNGPQGGAS